MIARSRGTQLDIFIVTDPAFYRSQRRLRVSIMSEPSAKVAAPTGVAAQQRDHAGPVFEGKSSRRHVRVSVRRYKLRALAARLRYGRALAHTKVFANFVGFPRSGHSLIGSLLDAHPNAVIAHELDALGLFAKGVSIREIAALCASNSEAFTASGRWWNGYQYAVPGGGHGLSSSRSPITVIGDKKGDWVARWTAHSPDIIEQFKKRCPYNNKWILVTRHPCDNVATMSLRKGRIYDRLRIEHHEPQAFRTALAEAQSTGRIPATVLDEFVEDWRALCAATAQIKACVPKGDWHEIVYEEFVQAPEAGLSELCAFLGLPADLDWTARAASVVRTERSKSRERVSWQPHQYAALAETVAARDFLKAYRDDV